MANPDSAPHDAPTLQVYQDLVTYLYQVLELFDGTDPEEQYMERLFGASCWTHRADAINMKERLHYQYAQYSIRGSREALDKTKTRETCTKRRAISFARSRRTLSVR